MVNELSGLDATKREVNAAQGVIQQSDNEIALLTGSFMQVMIKMAAQIEAAFEHVSADLTIPRCTCLVGEEAKLKRLIT